MSLIPVSLPDHCYYLISNYCMPLSRLPPVITSSFQFCIPFALFITFVYAIIYDLLLRDTFYNPLMKYCGSFGECLTTVLLKSLRETGGGHNYR